MTYNDTVKIRRSMREQAYNVISKIRLFRITGKDHYMLIWELKELRAGHSAMTKARR